MKCCFAQDEENDGIKHLELGIQADADEIVFLKIKPICRTSVQIPEI